MAELKSSGVVQGGAEGIKRGIAPLRLASIGDTSRRSDNSKGKLALVSPKNVLKDGVMGKGVRLPNL